MAKHLVGMAHKFEQRLIDLIDDMRDARMHCYEDEDGVHYIQFGDGSVMVEPDADQIVIMDVNEWLDFENASHVTECGRTSEDEQITAVLNSTINSR